MDRLPQVFIFHISTDVVVKEKIDYLDVAVGSSDVQLKTNLNELTCNYWTKNTYRSCSVNFVKQLEVSALVGDFLQFVQHLQLSGSTSFINKFLIIKINLIQFS